MLVCDCVCVCVCVCVQQKQAAISQTHLARTLAARERLGYKKRIDITRIIKEVSEAGGRGEAQPKLLTVVTALSGSHSLAGFITSLSFDRQRRMSISAFFANCMLHDSLHDRL